MGKACGTMKKSKCKKEADRCSWQKDKCVEADGDKDDDDKDDSDKDDGDASDDGDDDDKAKCSSNKNKNKCGKDSQCEWKNGKCVEASDDDKANEKACGTMKK